MASIEKYTKDGKDVYLVRYTTYVDGKRKQHMKRGFNKERDAKAFANRIEAQIADGEYIEKDEITLDKYIGKYMELYCINLAPGTRADYEWMQAKIAAHGLGGKALQKVSPEDIQGFINYLQTEGREPRPKKNQKEPPPAKGLGAKTVTNYIQFLRKVFQQAAINKKVKSNPVEHIARPKIMKHEHKILTIAELTHLIKCAANTPMYMPVILAGCMGLRRGEALGLRWQDVDFKNNTITIRQTRQKRKGEEIIKSPKTLTSSRVLHMPEVVSKALKAYKANVIIDISHNLVCSVSTGEPVSVDTFGQRFNRLLKRAKMDEGIRFHDLRHTSAAILTAAGANPKEVSSYLGHAGIEITMNLYADIFEENKKQTAQKLDALLGVF